MIMENCYFSKMSLMQKGEQRDVYGNVRDSLSHAKVIGNV